MEIFLVNGNVVTENEFWSELESEVRSYAEDNIDEIIDETSEEIHIGSLTYSPSQVLKKVDPIAYRCSIDDYANSLYVDAKYELMSGETITTIDDVEFAIEYEEDEENA